MAEKLIKEKYMRFGKIYTAENREEARNLIGKIVAFDNNYADILAFHDGRNTTGVLNGINESNYPFSVAGMECQFIREWKQPMTNRQLAEWCAKGFGQWKHEPSNSGTVYHSYWNIEEVEDDFVGDDIVVRPWGTYEWIEPTKDVYERCCNGRDIDTN